jgi:hypothetical protein
VVSGVEPSSSNAIPATAFPTLADGAELDEVTAAVEIESADIIALELPSDSNDATLAYDRTAPEPGPTVLALSMYAPVSALKPLTAT